MQWQVEGREVIERRACTAECTCLSIFTRLGAHLCQHVQGWVPISAKMCTAVGTGDHRYGDAAIFVPFFGALKGYVEDPENFDETKYKENARYDELKDK